MAQTYTCDWCGDEIASAADGVSGVARLNISGLHTDTWFVSRDTRHFHAGARDDDDSCFQRALSVFDEHLANSPRPRVVDHVKQRQEARDVWGQLSSERREALLLNALADNRLTIRELASGMGDGARLRPGRREWGAGRVLRAPVGEAPVPGWSTRTGR
jgi:hypothetical protein